MEKLILYSFTGDQYIESYDIVCIKAIRVLNFLQIDYDLKIISLTDDLKKFERSLMAVPTFYYKDQIYYLWKDIIPLIQSLSKNDKLQEFHLSPQESSYQVIIEQWAYSALDQTTNYFVNEVKENRLKFAQNIGKLFDNEKIIKTLNQYNKNNREFLAGTIFSRLEYNDAVERLTNQLSALNQLLKEHQYLIKDDITYADIATFACIHVLFHPFIQETHQLSSKFPHLIRWANLIDRITQNEHTRKFNISEE